MSDTRKVGKEVNKNHQDHLELRTYRAKLDVLKLIGPIISVLIGMDAEVTKIAEKEQVNSKYLWEWLRDQLPLENIVSEDVLDDNDEGVEDDEDVE